VPFSIALHRKEKSFQSKGGALLEEGETLGAHGLPGWPANPTIGNRQVGWQIGSERPLSPNISQDVRQRDDGDDVVVRIHHKGFM
jgi:hypothetical protein